MATAPRNRMKSLCHVLPLVLLFASSPSGRAQEDLCPDFAEIDPLIDCLTVSSYGALVDLIESAPSGAQLDLCPFFLMKVESVVPARVLSGIQVRCIRKTSDDFCVISGEGHHLWIDTSENTLWQGMSFRNSNDHAVYIAGESDNSELASHTFCHTSFIENVRFLDSRGGALMIEPSVGTVNIVETLFSENFSKSYGAGIYARGHQLNVVNSVFSRNRANGYGPAIFTASDVSLMIKGSTFVGNLGRDRFEVVFNGAEGTEIYEDGFGNINNNRFCRGIFNLATETCVEFDRSLDSSNPSTIGTNSPTVPATNPTSAPSVAVVATESPATSESTGQTSMAPSGQDSVQISTESPTLSLTAGPAALVSDSPSSVPSNSPSSRPKLVDITPNDRPPTRPKLVDITSTNSPSGRQKLVDRNPSLSPSSSTNERPATSEAPQVSGRISTESPTLSPTLDPTELSSDTPSFVPSASPSFFPTQLKISPPTLIPSPNPTIAPGHTGAPAITHPATSFPSEKAVPPSICTFDPFEGDCIQVGSYDEFKAAVEQGGDEVVLCGGFIIQKTEAESLRIAHDVDLRCLRQCTLFGTGPFMEIGGALTEIRIHNVKFQNSVNATAVLVAMGTSHSVTSFCEAEFVGNRAVSGASGGAIAVGATMGVVNIVKSTFTANSADRGGAIYSEGTMLNIVDSRFVFNGALQSGSAIYVGDGSHIAIEATIFILNEAETINDETPAQGNYAVAVQPSMSIRDGLRLGETIDNGQNRVTMGGDCNGFWKLSVQECLEFDS